ncbi:hypothetical protein GL263_24780 [Streptomyces durbertensis]|uniref:Secreted protein n=1 Tax=Streptomyces durbertensis TaxID=2448886 RepID=A0ABR6EN37_9ACTN|nr:hypothetical protein [Streptomyces durbertensis]MBB1246741.1 hypothetical protein [Streptomyces durbertensis]
MRSQLKLAAVVGVVILALSGFTPAKRGGTDGGDGGGCGRDSSSGTSGGSSSGGTTGGSADKPKPTANIVRCAGVADPTADVQVSAPSSRSGSWTVTVRFMDDSGIVVSTGSERVSLEAGQSRNITVRMTDPARLDEVANCGLEPVN